MIEVNRDGEVWVYAEQQDGELREVVLELCGKARELADELDVPAGAVLIGSRRQASSPEQLIAYGHRPCLLPGRSAARALPDAPVCADRLPAPSRRTSRRSCSTEPRRWAATWPRVSPREMRAGMTADCTDLEIKDVTEPRTQRGPRETAAADSPGLWRKHHRHDRQLRHVAADGDGPRRRHADARSRSPRAPARSMTLDVELSDDLFAIKLIEQHIRAARST